MGRFILFIPLCCLILSCNQPPTLEEMAKGGVEKYFEEINEKLGNVELSSIKTETKLINDSLCIIEANYDVHDEKGEKFPNTIEYVYLIYENKAYEAYQLKGLEDFIFCPKDVFDMKKKGEIYEELSYDDAMYYLASTIINDHGRLIENHQGEVKIQTSLGNWKLFNIEDEFGDKTQDKYIGAKGRGTIKLDANRDIDMTVYLFIRHEEVFFKFHVDDLKYTSYYNLPIFMKIKDADGEIYSFDFLCKNNGEISMNTDKEDKQSFFKFISIIEKGGIISGSTQINNLPYNFKIDVSGYKDAIKKM